MNLSDLLSDLGNQIGLGPLKLDDSGVCRLVFDGDVSIDLEAGDDDGNSLLLHSVVGTTPPEGRLAYYSALLTGSYLGTQTVGGSLSLDPSTGEAVLWTSLEIAQLDTEVLANKLTAFTQAIRHWTEELANAHEVEVGSDAEEDFSRLSMLRV